MVDSTARPQPFLGLEGPLAIAHRGGGAERPENTMAAFEHAVGLGYRCIEMDVRATRDGVVVVYHDEQLDRLTGHAGPLAARSWRELAVLRVRDAEPIARLDDVLAAWPDLRLIIDPKSDDVVGPLIEVLRRANARQRVCVGSFSSRRLRWIRTDAPGCTSCGPLEALWLRAQSWGLPTGTVANATVSRILATRRRQPPNNKRGHWLMGADCAQVPPRHTLFRISFGTSFGISIPVVDAAFIRAAHARGMPVQVWTVDEEQEIERLLDLGVDGIMSDRVTALKRVFERRSLWR